MKIYNYILRAIDDYYCYNGKPPKELFLGTEEYSKLKEFLRGFPMMSSDIEQKSSIERFNGLEIVEVLRENYLKVV